jgi:hypothetical protein
MTGRMKWGRLGGGNVIEREIRRCFAERERYGRGVISPRFKVVPSSSLSRMQRVRIFLRLGGGRSPSRITHDRFGWRYCWLHPAGSQ